MDLLDETKGKKNKVRLGNWWVTLGFIVHLGVTFAFVRSQVSNRWLVGLNFTKQTATLMDFQLMPRSCSAVQYGAAWSAYIGVSTAKSWVGSQFLVLLRLGTKGSERVL